MTYKSYLEYSRLSKYKVRLAIAVKSEWEFAAVVNHWMYTSEHFISFHQKRHQSKILYICHFTLIYSEMKPSEFFQELYQYVCVFLYH